MKWMLRCGKGAIDAAPPLRGSAFALIQNAENCAELSNSCAMCSSVKFSSMSSDPIVDFANFERTVANARRSNSAPPNCPSTAYTARRAH